MDRKRQAVVERKREAAKSERAKEWAAGLAR
jgi:hypothetical protein